MAWLSRFIASILTLALTSTIVLLVMAQTVLSSQYLEAKLTATDSYTRLSTALSAEVAKDTGSVDPAVNAKVQTILTPAVVRQKLNATLEQLQAYYQGKGPVPTIDLTDIAAQAQAAGIPLGTDTDLTRPIKLGPDITNSQGEPVRPDLSRTRMIGVVISMVLAVALGLLCWKRREYRPLANVLIAVGISVGFLALFFGLSPGLFDRLIRINTSSNAFVGVTHDVLASIAHDLGLRLGIIALVCLIVGVTARILIRRSNAARLAANAEAPAYHPNQTV